jgi:transcriptional regulator with XRE-family HTH domain
MLSSEQIRGARAMLRWDQSRLAEEADVSVETIKRLEKMDGQLLAVTGTTLAKIEQAIDAAGVDLINSTGVKLRIADTNQS